MRLRPLAAAIVVAWAGLVSPLPPASPYAPPPARAQDAPYTLETTASYAVDPEGGQIRVNVDVTFTNRSPDPADAYTVFPDALLAVHQGAAEIAASDGDGPLEVSTEPEGGANVATISLRDPIRFEESAEFSLDYVLLDAASDGIRVRPSATVFPAWGFGTSSAVTVQVPAGYDVSVRGDALESEDGEEVTTLTSGPIEEPARWVAIVTANRDTPFVTQRRSVPLESGTADLRVESWADDEAWGTRTLDLLAQALPVIEREMGLPYEHAGPLTVTESVARSQTGFDGEQSAGILLGFDQPPFTALHEAAHIWIGPNLFSSRWIYEGFASHYAAIAGAQIDVEPPYDPAAAVEDHADLAFPLDEWLPEDDPNSERDAYGYPASWTVANQIAARAGAEPMREVLRRIAAGERAYEAGDDETSSAPAAAARLVDSRALLDHLEETVGTPFDDLFSAHVFSADTTELLTERTAARTAFAALEESAGGWGPPRPVVDAMSDWEFPTAMERMEAATAWLADRDALLADLDDAGLRVPESLRAAYRDSAGLPAGEEELAAHRAFLDAYNAAREESRRDLSRIEEIGLMGTSDPASDLDTAADRFAAGELEDAHAIVSDVADRLRGAEFSGILRIASLIIFAFGLAVVIVARILRPRRSHID